MESGLSYSILRPTVIYGMEDILINNIAWFIRHFPVFGIPGDGCYGVRPIYVEDMARLMVEAAEPGPNKVIDAVGPETFTFEEIVKLIAARVGHAGPHGESARLFCLLVYALNWPDDAGRGSNLGGVQGAHEQSACS